jgi:hypothetical protein
MPIAFLLALQASGMVIDYLGKQQQIAASKQGAEIEQAGITANIANSRLQYEDESLQSMKQLRQNLGTQVALNAARGTRSGQGNAIMSETQSVGNFNADARMRKINQLGNEASLKAGMTLSKLHENTTENNVWNEFRKNALNSLPTSPSAYSQYANAFSGSKASSSFGLTRIGG